MNMTMWLGAEWTEEVERRTAKQLRGFVGTGNIAEGFRLFQAGKVLSGEWEKGKKYNAEIHSGNEGCKTCVQLDFLPYSRCSCSTPGSCYHMAAVFMQALFASGIHVLTFLSNQQLLSEGELAAANQSASETAAASEAATIPAASASLAKQELNKASASDKQLATPASYDGYRKWHRIFKNIMPRYYGSAADFPNWIESNLMQLADEWTDVGRAAAYRLHALFYAMQLVDNISDYGIWRWNEFNVATENLYRMLPELTNHLMANLAASDHEDTVGELLLVLSDFGFAEERRIIDWLNVYRNTCNRLTLSPELLEREMKRLEPFVSGEEASWKMINATAAYAHLILFEQGDTAAIRYLDACWNWGVEPFYLYAKMYANTHKWGQMRLWMDWMQPKIVQTGESTERYLAMWGEMAPHLFDADAIGDERRKQLQALLPASFEAYEEHLIRHRDYRVWVDLYLHTENNLHDSRFYEDVLKKAPEVLLPFYHLHAERWTGRKNRTGYQNAVQHLLQLKQLYKGMKREGEWQSFFRRYQARHARLKALQEEMEGSGLLG